MSNEIWKDIPGYEGIYQASTLGRIKSINPSGKGVDIIMSEKSISNGYKMVYLKRGKKPKTFLIHRLIAMTFLDNPDSLPIVNHKNENKLDNRVTNLEWCTANYNCSYGSRKNSQAQKLGTRVLCVEKNLKFQSFGEASRALNIPYQNISRCCKLPNRTAGGYHWKIVD